MKKLAMGAAAAGLAVFMGAGTAVIALADEEDSRNADVAGGEGLNVKLLPAKARPYVPWINRSAKQCEGLTPGILAAQLDQESGFDPGAIGPETHSGRAVGIAQFLPSTFATYGSDSDTDGKTGPKDPEDSIMAQGKYMCSLIARAQKSGYGGDPVKLALAGYNAGWGNVQKYGGIPPFQETSRYVARIMANASKFNTAVSVQGTGDGAEAVRRAATQLGVPYVWGGGKPSGPSTGFCDGTNGYLNGSCFASGHEGFDCSSLVQFAYWPSRQLPRVASDQYKTTAGHPVSKGELKTGDLLFWGHGSADSIYHVAMYYKDGKVLHAPRTGKDVEVKDMDQAMPRGDYIGATRP